MISKELDVVVELLFNLRVPTLRVYAKSHNIRLGKNKAELIENIINSITKWRLHLEAPPKGDLLVSFVLTPEGSTPGVVTETT